MAGIADPFAAGQEALGRAAWEEARAAFEAALAQAETPEALEGLASATLWLDDARGTFRAFERAYSLYRQAGDRRGAARTAMWLGLGSEYLRGEWAVASGWLERAGRLLEGIDATAEHAWLAVWRAHFALLRDHDVEAASALNAEALALAAALGDPELQNLALAQEGLILVSTGAVAEGMRRLDEATTAALAGEVGSWVAVSNVCCYLIYACKRVRDYDRAAQWCDRVQELSLRYSDRITFAACRTHYTDILILRGSFAAADEEISANAAELVSLNRARATDAVVRLAELRRRQGRLDEAEALAAEAESHSRAPLVRAALALDLGRPEEAADLAERFLRRIPAEEATERAEGLELLVQGAAAAGRSLRAEEALAELEAIAATVGTTPLLAAAAFAAGAAAAAAGDPKRAQQRFEDALDLYGRSGTPFEAARARLALAHALEELGQAAGAVREARAALEAFLALGASHEAERAAAAARRLGAGVPSRVADPAGLTRREREVLRLVAQGKSNQEIAAELVLSVRTVERHIANIYDKIGAAGKSARATATAYALGHGLA